MPTGWQVILPAPLIRSKAALVVSIALVEAVHKTGGARDHAGVGVVRVASAVARIDPPPLPARLGQQQARSEAVQRLLLTLGMRRGESTHQREIVVADGC